MSRLLRKLGARRARNLRKLICIPFLGLTMVVEHVRGLDKMSIEIVPYDSKHQSALVDLWKQCDLVVPSNDPVEDIQKKLEFQPQLLLVALLDGELVGSVMVGYEGHRGWLNYLAVSPRYQGRGYGRQLVLRAVDKLREFDCLKVNVQVRSTNSSAAGFYKHLGFKDDNVISLGLRLKGSIIRDHHASDSHNL